MDEKGQGAIEYLLLIAAAVLVAAVVIYTMANILAPTKNTINEELNHGLGHFTTGSP